MSVRQRIYQTIEPFDASTLASRMYDIVMIVAIVASLVPLLFKESMPLFDTIERITVALFIVDYILRLITADFKLGRGRISFIPYPFTPMAIIDLLSILPALLLLWDGFKALRIFRLVKALRVFRIFKLFRYSKNIGIISDVVRSQKDALIAVCALAVMYVFVAALVVFTIEPDTFEDFFEAVYWATISLTTVGYGDIYPVTTAGRVVAMISSVAGIAVVALPAGIITAGYMEEINKKNSDVIGDAKESSVNSKTGKQ